MLHNYSEACERNQQPILDVLQHYLQPSHRVLEIGSGSGQHALFCVEQLQHNHWQPSELPGNLAALQHNLSLFNLSGIRSPIPLDVSMPPRFSHAYDLLFTANTLHIMSWSSVQDLIRLAGEIIAPEGFMVVYGPFRYQNAYTSPSNAAFDQWLKQRDPQSGIRDFEALESLANDANLFLLKDWTMPANNQCLVWQKQG